MARPFESAFCFLLACAAGTAAGAVAVHDGCSVPAATAPRAAAAMPAAAAAAAAAAASVPAALGTIKYGKINYLNKNMRKA